MNRIGSLLIAFVLFFFVFPVPSIAQEEKMIAPLPGIDSAIGLLGQQQYYSVQMRGNGEAVVVARLIFSNTTAVPLETVALRIPRVIPTDLLALQIIREPRCINQMLGSEALPSCLQYEAPDFFQYGYDNAKYERATGELRTDTLLITLPHSIAPNASGSILLSYRAMGYAKRTLFGTYEFTFETFKTEDRIQEVQVGITVDDELFLSGAKGQTQYRFSLDTNTMMEAPTVTGGVTNTRLDTFVQQIGQGTMTKTARNLQPLDSFTVSGSYADALWKLHATSLFIAVLVLIGGVSLLIFFSKKVVLLFTEKNAHASRLASDTMLVLGISFLSAFLTVAFTILLFFIRNKVTQWYPSDIQFIFSLLAMIIALGVYAILILAPSFLIFLKKGLHWAVATFALTILWLLFDAVVVAVVMAIFFGQNQPYPVPYPMRGAMEAPQSLPPDAPELQEQQ